jgi:hypothetical protein
MNDFDETIPSTVTRKKRKSGLKISTKKALKRSKEVRLIAKARGYDFSSTTKKLAFIDRLSSERCIADLKGCASKTNCPKLLEPIEENEEEKNEFSLEDAITTIEHPEKVNNI